MELESLAALDRLGVFGFSSGASEGVADESSNGDGDGGGSVDVVQEQEVLLEG